MDDLHSIILLLPHCNTRVSCVKVDDSYDQTLVVFDHSSFMWIKTKIGKNLRSKDEYEGLGFIIGW